LRNASYSYVSVSGSAKASLTTGKHYLNMLLEGWMIYATEATNIIKINWVYLYWYDDL
jgi:hypothetical protein